MSDEQAKKTAELLARKAGREQARAEQLAAAQVEGVELEDRFETELGARGVEFEMVDVSAFHQGWIVVKRPEAVVHKRWVVAVDKANNTKRPIDEADVALYVSPSVVHPTPERYREIVAKHPEVANRCSLACHSLAGAQRSEAQGKF